MLTRLHASTSTSIEACAAATSFASSAVRRPRGVASSFTTTHASFAVPVSSAGGAESSTGSWEYGVGSGEFSGSSAAGSLTRLWFSGKLMLHSLSKRNWLCMIQVSGK